LEERLRLSALCRTLGESLPGVERMRFLVHGQALDRWGGHIQVGPSIAVTR
jgi:hypothetical protein